ncbi:glycosyltransferase [Pseudodesulfovibrio sp. JC047]|uniref:glycosyltransferase n=1 Tax=Pseudodesulfovibrio sp. JC047 TaxID=2683199 RepID=UPI0013D7DF9F|nr:glycosyltransferase [Pseudodesulfovibrio sp. JC047]NDV20409.1 glycosyltransferase [Pseudodesulfovibrio sp. JC047]
MRTSIPVLCYHNVNDIDGHTPELFCEHLDAMIDAGWHTISARELLAVTRGQMKAPKKTVVLTFDDGHLSNWLTVVPELEKRNMTGTFFGLSDFTIDGPVRTMETAPDMVSMPDAFRNAHLNGDFSQFMTTEEFKAILDKGMEVFSHGRRHQGAFLDLKPLQRMGNNAHWGAWSIYPGFNAAWPTFKVGSGYVYDGFQPVLDGSGEPRFVQRSTADRLAFCRRDFRKSMDWIRELNGYDEQLFCWPWGQFCPDAQDELRKAGYVGAFTLERWVNAKGTNPFRLNRIGVGKKKTGAWIQSRLRMYGSDPAARVFFKLHTKRPEVHRVLFTTDSVKLSGGSRQMVNNIKAMSEMGITTYALLTSDSPINDALKDLDVEIIHFDGFRHYLKAGRFLKKLVKEHAIDVVHTFHNRAYKMGVLARLMGAKYKLFINRGVISKPNSIFFLWTALANGVITNSRQCADILRAHHVLKRRLNVVYNAYVGPDFGTPKPRKKRGIRFIYIGNNAHIKGYDVFLDAAAALCEKGCRDMEFVAVGVPQEISGDLAAHLTPAVRERLRATGTIPHNQVLEELAFADVQVMTSRKESLPNVLLEGFALGVPAICTRVGGVPEIIQDGVNGFLCDNEDSACLAEKMQAMADDSKIRYSMGYAGHALVSTMLTPEAKGRNLMRVYMGERLDEPLDLNMLPTVQDEDEPFGHSEH